MNEKRNISFHFHPYQYDKSNHAVEKSDGKGQRRYLIGVSSGPRVDAHGERMTEKAIRSFMDQANAGDVLLYPDIHGIKSSEDIGILVKAEILENGDWYTEYRLYDNLDGVDDVSVQKADKIWKQINGLPPYTTPKQKGYSIEGFIPQTKEAVFHDVTGKAQINEVKLDGVCIVPRPAYEDSIAHAVYKALDEMPPWKDPSTISSRLHRRVREADERDSFYHQRYQIEEARDQLIQEVMESGVEGRQERLDVIFTEYQSLMVNLIMGHESAFSTDEIRRDLSQTELTVTKSNLLKGLIANIDNLYTVNKGVL